MRPYHPSNGTEGMMFIEMYCDHCIHQHPDPDNPKQCDILGRTMCYTPMDKEYPKEWIYDEGGKPTCTAFVKWNWGSGDDGIWNEPPPPPIHDPRQLFLPLYHDLKSTNEKIIKTYGRKFNRRVVPRNEQGKRNNKRI